MGQALTSRAENTVANKGNYQTLLTDLQSIQTGPQADRQNHIAAFFQKWAGSPLIAGLTTQDLAAGEGFQKIATQKLFRGGLTLIRARELERRGAFVAPVVHVRELKASRVNIFVPPLRKVVVSALTVRAAPCVPRVALFVNGVFIPQ